MVSICICRPTRDDHGRSGKNSLATRPDVMELGYCMVELGGLAASSVTGAGGPFCQYEFDIVRMVSGCTERIRGT